MCSPFASSPLVVYRKHTVARLWRDHCSFITVSVCATPLPSYYSDKWGLQPVLERLLSLFDIK